jgi:hypothetical protein
MTPANAAARAPEGPGTRATGRGSGPARSWHRSRRLDRRHVGPVALDRRGRAQRRARHRPSDHQAFDRLSENLGDRLADPAASRLRPGAFHRRRPKEFALQRPDGPATSRRPKAAAHREGRPPGRAGRRRDRKARAARKPGKHQKIGCRIVRAASSILLPLNAPSIGAMLRVRFLLRGLRFKLPSAHARPEGFFFPEAWIEVRARLRPDCSALACRGKPFGAHLIAHAFSGAKHQRAPLGARGARSPAHRRFFLKVFV